MKKAPAPRPYRKRKRAEKEEETRQRIVDALMWLHSTLGPAKTTVTEVAERAGVSRMTVYNHFPTDADLIEGCSSHWASLHPYPDPSGWERIVDTSERLRAALTELYEWYRTNEDMMGKVFRDAPVMEALGEFMDANWRPYAAEIVRVLAAGREVPAVGHDELVAALRLVVDFDTWRTFDRCGFDDARAAELASRMVAGIESAAPAT